MKRTRKSRGDSPVDYKLQDMGLARWHGDCCNELPEMTRMNHPPIERVLCPTDFSPFSTQALRHALALTRQFGSRLKVLHVISHSVPSAEARYRSAPWAATPEFRDRIDEEMREFLQPLREARIDHEIEVREGDPWRGILDASVEMSSDLVVLGTHGRSGLERLFLGSVTEKLVRRLPCPVLTVSHEEGRTWAAPGLIKAILCATDFSETSNEAFRMAVAFAEAFDARITLLHAVESLPDFGEATRIATLDVRPLRDDLEYEARERLDKAVAEVSENAFRVTPRVECGRAYREILRTAAEERSDLVVIGAQGHGLVEHMLSGSNAQHVIRSATCPVLTARTKSAPARNATGPTGITLRDAVSPAESRKIDQ